MADYFVSPKEETDFHLDSKQFADALVRRWPEARASFIEEGSGPNGLRWSVPMPHGEIDGALNRAGQVVVLDGDVLDSAEFAQWVRQQVPERYELFFYDEGYSADVPLTAATSVDDLVEPFVRSPRN